MLPLSVLTVFATCARTPLPQVPVAHDVPLEAFASLVPPEGLRGWLACTWLDPDARLLRGEPRVLTVTLDEARFGDVRVPLDGQGRPVDGIRDLFPLLDESLAWRERSWAASEAIPCADDFADRLLIRARPEVPVETLRLASRLLEHAEVWLEVDAERGFTRTAIDPDGDCWQMEILSVTPDGTLTHEKRRTAGADTRVWDARTLPGKEGAPDLDALRAVLDERPWARHDLTVLDGGTLTVGALAALVSPLDHARDARVTPFGAFGHFDRPLTPSGRGATTRALPLAQDIMPGECLFASEDPTCKGSDGRLHLQDADNCRDGAALALFELTRGEARHPVAVDEDGRLFFPKGEPDGQGVWTLAFVEGNPSREAEVIAGLEERGFALTGR
ncbi:MAG: hypothetical protein H6739_31500 [Alphaproteobacteria bacterium]|nr:hypothetical protein [Alphaproteobacteria bacterium]